VIGPVGRMASRARSLDRPIAVLAAMAFITQLGVSVMLPLLPLYAQSLGATPFVLSLLVGGFAIALAGGQLASGFLAGRFASRRLVVTGIGTYAGANVAIAWSSTAAQLIAFRALAGLGSGINQVAERLYLTQVADRARLAFSNGILSAAGSAGSVLGPTFGGVLAAIGDLRVPFIVVGITSLSATVAGWFLPPPAPREPAIRDPAEAGGAGWEARSPMRLLIVLFFVQLAFQATFGAFITTYAPFASERLGWSTAEIGLVFSLFGLGSILLGPWLARQADRHGRRLFGIIGCALIFPFAIAYVAGAPRLILYPVSVFTGAGVTTIEAAWFALLSDATDGARQGRAFGTIVALSSLGIVIGSTVAAQLWERSGDVGLGLLVASATVAISGILLLAHPADHGAAPSTA
jgi:DHA1 family multidrug resistance protein-like MFS transporter